MASVTRRPDSDEHYAKKVYELPSDEMENLCSVLDEDESWKDLGRECLKLSPAVLKKIARNTAMRNESPTEELIRQMGSLDYSVERLFTCLYDLKNFKAMETIKSFVHPRFHNLIPENLTSESIMSDRRHEERKPLLLSTPGRSSTSGTSPSEGSTMLKHIPSFSCDKLQAATRNWTSEEVGRGGFGVVLKFKLGGTDYVVKLLRPTKRERAELRVIEPRQMLRRLKKELNYSNKCRHNNILSLYGWSVCEKKAIYALVYPFMARKSLHEFLHERKGELPWKTRVKIAKGIACGLISLHNTMSPPVVHGDIKSANILLDENFCPKIGDFGLARQLPYDQCSFLSDASYRGTRHYSPPEYRPSRVASESFHGEFSTKIDVYAFGVVLYEIITGCKSLILDRIITESDHEPKDIYKRLKISDIRMTSDDDSKACELLTSIGELCVRKERISRPEMVQVFPKFGKGTETTEAESESESEFDNPGSAPLSEDSLLELMTSISDEEVNLKYYELDSDETDDDSSE